MRCDDVVDLLRVAALEERKQRAWEATESLSVTGRAGKASSPRGTSDMWWWWRLRRCFDISGGEIKDENLRGCDVARVKLLRFALIQYGVVTWTLCMCRK
jgi:hypothetical protein